MKRIIVLALLVLPMMLVAQFSVVSNISYDYGKDYKIAGVDAVVLLEQLDSLSQLSYKFSAPTNAEWHYHTASYDSLITSSVVIDTITTLDSLQQGLYELEIVGDTSYYYYVVDFSEYQNSVDSVWLDDTYNCCENITLYANISVENIPVYDKLNDTTHLLAEPKTDFVWLMDTTQEQGESKHKIDAPLEDIAYGCVPHSADFFANDFQVLYSDADTSYAEFYNAVAIELSSFTYTIPEKEDLSNELVNSTAVKGSAPLDVTYDITYKGNTDYTAWWIWEALNEQPNSPTYRNQDQVFYTFEKFVKEPGYRVKVVVSNDSCAVMDSVDVMVTESKLEVPNVLVLGWGAVGIFKVAYQSIDPSSFDARVYDRKGRLIYKWEDPDQGWDGRVPAGGYVSPGAYYYSIRARGTDGERYEKIGDVSVVREKGIK